MRLSLAAAFAYLQARVPAPVLFVDTCIFLDLFRSDRAGPRAPHLEIQAAANLLGLAAADAAHLVVLELVPREYHDNAATVSAGFENWAELHDTNQEWLVEAGREVSLTLPPPRLVRPLGIGALLRGLAERLLAKAVVLERDPGCLERAVQRLISKARPSHKKEMKDSMNLEQCLSLSRRLETDGFPRSRVWVSSNINDFAEPTSSLLHPDLQEEFVEAGLQYSTSLRAALGTLRTAGEFSVP